LLAKSAMEQNYKCKFCGTKFHREKTLATHMCAKKQRHIDINTTGSRFGLRAFQRFYELTTHSKKPKTTDEFINSPYYTEFAKFGNHLANLRPIYIEKYIDFVIMGGVPLKDWTKDNVYYLYVEDLIKKEPPTSAVERTISEIVEWCSKNNVQFKDFFCNISANEGSHLIKTGRLSPWVLYLATSAEELMSKFNEDHAKIIGGVIEPSVWMKKFKSADDDVKYIKEVLEQAGL
jgi:hypothetical protein